MPVVTKATPEDAEALHRIAKRLQLEGRDLNAAMQGGYFLYVGSVADYRKTICDSPFCFVATEDEECIGFLTTVTPESIASMPAGPKRKLFEEHGEFPLLIEQIGVTPDWQHRGVGQALLDQLVGESTTARLMATVVHAPVRNHRSIAFLLRNGWKLHREVTTAKRVWGFYEWRR